MPYTPRDYGLCESLKEKKERGKRDLNYWRRKNTSIH